MTYRLARKTHHNLRDEMIWSRFVYKGLGSIAASLFPALKCREFWHEEMATDKNDKGDISDRFRAIQYERKSLKTPWI